jgi:DNA-binding CsgD family transcriptional regulator
LSAAARTFIKGADASNYEYSGEAAILGSLALTRARAGPTPLPLRVLIEGGTRMVSAGGEKSETSSDDPEDTARILSARQEPGLVLVSCRRPGKILGCNAEAQEILDRAESAAKDTLDRVRGWIRTQRRQTVGRPAPPAWTFRSGRRTYALRGLWINGTRGGPVVALLLERINPRRLGLERCRRQYHLSARELDVVSALSEGRTDKQIALALGVGTETVRGYLKSIRAKLGVSTRTAILHKLSDLAS